MLGIPRRYGHFVYGAVQSGLRQLPFLGGELVCGALATVLADLLASDVAGRAGRGTCHS